MAEIVVEHEHCLEIAKMVYQTWQKLPSQRFAFRTFDQYLEEELAKTRKVFPDRDPLRLCATCEGHGNGCINCDGTGHELAEVQNG